MSSISSVLTYFIGDSWLSISVWPSLHSVHLPDIVGVMYCTMVLICVISDLFPVKAVLLLLGADSDAVEIWEFLLHQYV